MHMLHDGWFTERSPDSIAHENGHTVNEENGQASIYGWPGQAFSLEVQEILHHKESDFQDILVFDRYFYLNDYLNSCTVNL